jgi:hypothetical protein
MLMSANLEDIEHCSDGSDELILNIKSEIKSTCNVCF